MENLVIGIKLWIMGYAKGMNNSSEITEKEMKENLRIAIIAAKTEFCSNMFGFHTEYECAVNEIKTKYSL